MIKLFLDTSTSVLRIGTLDNDKLLAYKEIDAHRKFTDITVNCIKETLAENQLKIQHIKQVYVTTGPGSFTGVRVGLTIAKTWITLNPKIELFTCDTLRLQVHGTEQTSLIDARGKKDYYLHNGEYGVCESGKYESEHKDFVKYIFRPQDLDLFQKEDNPLEASPLYIKKVL